MAAAGLCQSRGDRPAVPAGRRRANL